VRTWPGWMERGAVTANHQPAVFGSPTSRFPSWMLAGELLLQNTSARSGPGADGPRVRKLTQLVDGPRSGNWLRQLAIQRCSKIPRPTPVNLASNAGFGLCFSTHSRHGNVAPEARKHLHFHDHLAGGPLKLGFGLSGNVQISQLCHPDGNRSSQSVHLGSGEHALRLSKGDLLL
jgi:hypothetical protein